MATFKREIKKLPSEQNLRLLSSLVISLANKTSSVEDKCITPWKAGETYQKDVSFVVYNGYIYFCSVTNKDDTFTESHWTKLADNFDELSVEDVKAFLNLTPEQLQTLSSIISDTEVRLDKTYSSSKIYTDIKQCLDDSKAYTLAELGKASGASYKVVSSTGEMTEQKYIYLMSDGSGSYNMYIVEDDGSATQIGNTTINLSDYYTKTEVDNDFLKKTDATSTYATITTVDNDRANVNKMVKHVGKYVTLDTPKDTDNTMERFYVGNDNISYQEFQDSTIVQDFKIFSQKYGLTPIILGDGNDLNDITRNTFFTANKPCANTPNPTGNFIGISAAHVSANGYGFQIACSANENQQTSKTRTVYIRHNYNNVWGEWDRILTSDDQTSNPNLLDNPWFTVNQRGKTSYSGNVYTVDRWKGYSKCDTVVNSDGSITLTGTAPKTTYFGQIADIEIVKRLRGKTITLSVDGYSSNVNCKIYFYIKNSATGTSKNIGSETIGTTRAIYSSTITIPDTDFDRCEWLDFSIPLNESVTVYSAKVELGSKSTLHLDSAPNYQQELAKCQRYYVKYTDLLLPVVANRSGSKLLFAPLTFPNNINKNNGIINEANYDINYINLNGTKIDKTTISSLGIYGVNNNTGYIQIELTSDITNVPSSGLIHFGRFEISADL